MKELTTRQRGGLVSAERNRAKDPDFYKNIGKKGGSTVRGAGSKGFAKMSAERLKAVSAKGGMASRRPKGEPLAE